jgi:hypothetical protein
MAGVDENLIARMNETAKLEPKQEPVTVHELVKSSLAGRPMRN